MNNVICHHGVKGMKWGVRKSNPSSGGSGSSRKSISTGEVKALKKSVDSTNQAVNEVRKINREMSSGSTKKAKAKARVEASMMTDKELRDRVNRLNMEQQYANLIESNSVSKGHARTEKILSNAGTILTVGSTALSIALAIKELKG